MFSAYWRKSDALKALGVSAILNSAFGLWPLHRDNLFLRIRCFLPIFQLIFMLICSLYELYFICDYAEYNVDILLVITFGIIALAKLIFCYVHRDKLGHNVESAIEDWSCDDPNKIDFTMCNRRRIYDRVTRIYLVVGAIIAFMYPLKIYFLDPDSFVQLTNNDDDPRAKNTTTLLKKRFLFPSICSFNNVSLGLYRAISINQCLQYLYSVGTNLTTDAFFITITCHLCGQFAVLKRRFASFKSEANVIGTRREYGILVSRHKHLLKLAQYLEVSFNMIVFTQIFMNLILINIAGFNFLVFMKKADKYGAMTNFGIIMFALIQTFMYAYIGENVSSHIEEIGFSIYEGPWRTVPKNISRDMILLMMRSNTSINLTCGKFFKMTRSTFTDVVKTSVSYLSVLNVLIKD